jgi:hypothetical protein
MLTTFTVVLEQSNFIRTLTSSCFILGPFYFLENFYWESNAYTFTRNRGYSKELSAQIDSRKQAYTESYFVFKPINSWGGRLIIQAKISRWIWQRNLCNKLERRVGVYAYSKWWRFLSILSTVKVCAGGFDSDKWSSVVMICFLRIFLYI